jgi:malonate-semialdehyde dehydrogenase (acetylating)/methylmalonate-semialdehyde dehydrogenase
MSEAIEHLIHGQRARGGSRTQQVFNPATGAASGIVWLADKVTVEQAIASAQSAFPAWRNTPPIKRAWGKRLGTAPLTCDADH